ncbi:hypothetical protein L1049_008618 [Liquidambar formosana]|uniref:Uncharacterized protein n=1 Tax=Liquidambar formosana TaxID=63359 RepID=A0AAP0S3T2_LIQFO
MPTSTELLLAGATLIAPVINYWWPGFPASLCKEAYYEQFLQDQWPFRVAHYTPWLSYWWNSQKLFPGSSAMAHSPDLLSRHDKELKHKFSTGYDYMDQLANLVVDNWHRFDLSFITEENASNRVHPTCMAHAKSNLLRFSGQI